MSTALLEPVRTNLRPTNPRPARVAQSPAVYIGTVAGFRDLPAIDLYNLLVPVGEHPVGSTVSRRTLERFGYRLPDEPRRGPAGTALSRETVLTTFAEAWSA